MLGDARKNFAYSTVAVIPSPATSGLTLTVATGDGVKFAGPGQVTIWPANALPTSANAEIARLLSVSGDVLTFAARAQEGTSARTVVVGDQIEMAPTAEMILSAERAAFLLMGA